MSRTDSRAEPVSAERLDALEVRALDDGALLFVAGDRRSRARGLAGLMALSADHALLLAPCRSIHTVGMRFALDLLWLDAAGHVVRFDADVAPRRLRTCPRARAVIETRAGCGERFARQIDRWAH
jgi:uncharacterized membrane protein (UPF0127 family)